MEIPLSNKERTLAQSLTQVYVHLIFSTKNRVPFLDHAIRPRVHAYLASTLRNWDSPFVVVGGVADHVHLLFELVSITSPAKLVEELKRESSKFIKTLGTKYQSFFWQNGYGMFSVSPTHRNDVETYVRNQEAHHRRHTFQDEFRLFLKRYGISYDEILVWT